MVHSTERTKPNKPYPDFPLFPHATGRWAKKILGKTRYFGRWDDWQGSLNQYLEQKDDLYARRTPRIKSDAVTVRQAANTYLAAKERQIERQTLSRRTWHEYMKSAKRVVAAFGPDRPVDDLRPEDFAALLASIKLGPVGLGNEIQRIRSITRLKRRHRSVRRRRTC